MGVLKQWLPYVLSGISAGGQYALIAVGYTMVYGILRLINFAHGDIFMVAGMKMRTGRRDFLRPETIVVSIAGQMLRRQSEPCRTGSRRRWPA